MVREMMIILYAHNKTQRTPRGARACCTDLLLNISLSLLHFFRSSLLVLLNLEAHAARRERGGHQSYPKTATLPNKRKRKRKKTRERACTPSAVLSCHRAGLQPPSLAPAGTVVTPSAEWMPKNSFFVSSSNNSPSRYK